MTLKNCTVFYSVKAQALKLSLKRRDAMAAFTINPKFLVS